MTYAGGLSNLPQPPSASKALVLAWIVEGVAVAMGLLLAFYAGIEGGGSGFFGIFVSVMPFATLSVIELTKIPLVALAFAVRGWAWRLLAMLALLTVTGATFENFVFGFERGFAERLKAVEAADLEARQEEQAHQRAQAQLPHLLAQQADLAPRLDALRAEAATIRQQARDDIDDARRETGATTDLRAERERLDRELGALEARRTADTDRERRRCAAPERRCNLTSIENGFRRQREEIERRQQELLARQLALRERAEAGAGEARQRRDAELATKERERAALQAALDTLRDQGAAAQRMVFEGAARAERAARLRDELIATSQLHRLSLLLFGSHEREALDRTKAYFVVSLAAIVALIGTVIAAMHYAVQAPAQRRPLANAIRAYYARKRRRLPVMPAMRRPRAGILRKLANAWRGYLARRRKRLVVTREVETVVDRLKLVYVPLNATEEQIAAIRRGQGLTVAKTGT